MRVLVIYESLYGNTRIIADCIAEGLRERHEVEVVRLGQATPELVGDSDAIVVGGPTHVHGMTTSMSRKIGAGAAARPDTGLTVQPGAGGAGLREWLYNISPGCGRPAAAFDTRLDDPAVLTGRASTRMVHLLWRRGYQLVTTPASFLVSNRSALLPGEAARARVWGFTLAGTLEPASPAKQLTRGYR